MERLTWLYKDEFTADIYDDYSDNEDGLLSINYDKVYNIIQKLGEYEQMEENGLLIKLKK